MTTTNPPHATTTRTIRKRKAHTKSRRGCGNCKLRRVKCDEGTPTCKRCVNFGVSCSYDGKTDLEPTMESTFSIDVLVPVNNAYNEHVLSFVTSPDPETTSSNASNASSDHSDFDDDDYAILERFRTRTAFTIGTEASQQLYSAVIPPLAKEFAFLMHLILTLTMMHERFLEDVKTEKRPAQSEPEAYHWYQGTVLFNIRLRQLYTPMTPSLKDAMWAGSVSLGCVAFFCVEGDTPSEVWPLKPPGPLDLDWLKISDGKKEVWRVANPLRADSVYNVVANEHINILAPRSPEAELPEGWKELWDGKPYRLAAGIVGELIHAECNRITVLAFLAFIARVEGEFLTALFNRDPKAMLLLGVWYAKLCPYRSWWTMRRSVLESQAICMYLEKNHPELVLHGPGRHLFEFVKSESGLTRGWGWRDFAREAGFAGVTGKDGLCQWREEHPVFVSAAAQRAGHVGRGIAVWGT